MIHVKLVGLLLALFLTSSACRSSADTAQAPAARKSETSPLIGDYRLGSSPVIDGDTVRVEGLENRARQNALDPEETIHSKADRQEAKQDFAA